MSEFFNNLQKNKEKGIFISGDENNGEYKRWYDNGKLFKHKVYKNGEINGEYKVWHPNGQLDTHCFCKDGKLNGEYKEWNYNGKLFKHCFYKDGEYIKSLLNE